MYVCIYIYIYIYIYISGPGGSEKAATLFERLESDSELSKATVAESFVGALLFGSPFWATATTAIPCPPAVRLPHMREIRGAPRNPAPGNHFLVRIVKLSGCHCTDGHSTKQSFH